MPASKQEPEDIFSWACRNRYGIEPPWEADASWQERTLRMVQIEQRALDGKRTLALQSQIKDDQSP